MHKHPRGYDFKYEVLSCSSSHHYIPYSTLENSGTVIFSCTPVYYLHFLSFAFTENCHQEFTYDYYKFNEVNDLNFTVVCICMNKCYTMSKED